MEESARILFSSVDAELDRAADNLRNRVFAHLQDVPWTPHQRAELQPIIRDELERFVQRLLGLFNNVGGVLPDGSPFYEIIANSEGTSADISGDGTDYPDLWYEYLLTRASSTLPD